MHGTDSLRALSFFRDSLGLEESLRYAGPGGAEAMIVKAGRAAIEVASDAQIEYIDAIEV